MLFAVTCKDLKGGNLAISFVPEYSRKQGKQGTGMAQSFHPPNPSQLHYSSEETSVKRGKVSPSPPLKHSRLDANCRLSPFNEAIFSNDLANPGHTLDYSEFRAPSHIPLWYWLPTAPAVPAQVPNHQTQPIWLSDKI